MPNPAYPWRPERSPEDVVIGHCSTCQSSRGFVVSLDGKRLVCLDCESEPRAKRLEVKRG